MKKLMLVLVVCLFASTYSFAQYQPEEGTVTTELKFAPFKTDKNTFAVDGLRLRYFLNEKHALRLDLDLGYRNGKLSDETTDETPNTKEEGKWNTFNFGLNLGYEYHINIAPRLSVYVGGAAGFGIVSAKTKYTIETINSSTTNKSEIEISGVAVDDIENPDNILGRSATTFNVKAFTGLDFYVYKGLYVGTEFSFGLNSISYGKLKTTTTIDNKKEEVKSNFKESYLNLLFEATPEIRLGWRF
ncbi:MAG: outer membrane beta-barrel protein [Barnesiella sp.]